MGFEDEEALRNLCACLAYAMETDGIERDMLIAQACMLAVQLCESMRI